MLRLTVSTTGSASKPPTGCSPVLVISFSISASSRPGRAASCTSTQSLSRSVAPRAARPLRTDSMRLAPPQRSTVTP